MGVGSGFDCAKSDAAFSGRAGVIARDGQYTDANSTVTIFNSGPTPITVLNASAYGMGCGWFAD